MPKIIPVELETMVKTLSKEGYSYSQVKKKVALENYTISRQSISNILNLKGKKRVATALGEPKPKNNSTPFKRTPEKIEQVRRLVDKKNPESYRSISNQTDLALSTICKIIHRDLNLTTRKKYKVHKLNAKHKKVRKTNSRKLYEAHLAGGKEEFAVTLDEAMVYVEENNRQRSICYVEAGKPTPPSWVLEKCESFKHGFMIIGILTGRGTLPLFRVPLKTTVNTEYYIEHVLKPVFTQYLPRIYRNEMHKVFFHHDMSSVHTSIGTMAYLAQLSRDIGISYLKENEMIVKGPDASPLDFYGFGFLKQQLRKSRCTTLEGTWKKSQEIWNTITTETIRKVYNSWKIRLREINRRNGEHIEQLKNIHNRKNLF